MTFKTTRAAFLTGAALLASPVFAQSQSEIIADEVIALSRAQGAEVTIGSRTISGDTLRLGDLRYVFTQNGTSAEMEMDWIEFREVGQTVEMTFAPLISGVMTPENQQGTMDVRIENEGLVYTLSGTPDARQYDITGQSFSMGVKMLDGPEELKALDITFTLNDLSGGAVLEGGVTGTVETTLNAGSANLIYVIDADEMKANMTSDMKDLILTYSGDQITAENATSLFEGDRGLRLGMSIGLNTFDGNFLPSNGAAMTMTGQAGTAFLDLSLGNGGVNYDVRATDLAYNVVSTALPIPPVDLTMSEYGMRFAMPMGEAGTQGDLAMRMTLRDLVVSEGIWAMIDPGQVLSREPATLNIDLSGNATTKVNFSNPESMARLGGPPLDVEDVAINDITLRIAGAEFLAKGAATLDNSGPIPVPTGKVNASLKGANGLIENLMQIGLLQPQQAMPARMMMGMFAVPGGGPDHLTSEIEFKADGSILANGIPLPVQ